MVYRAPVFPEFVTALFTLPTGVVHQVDIRVGAEKMERTVLRYSIEVSHGEHEGGRIAANDAV